MTDRPSKLSWIMNHSPGFLKQVNQSRPYVKEITVEEAGEMLRRDPKIVLMDVREDSEWLKDHAEKAIHLGKGILERDLEKTVPDPETKIIMYCGGGYRSMLTAKTAQEMGYQKVYSLAGGYKALVKAGWRMKTGG